MHLSAVQVLGTSFATGFVGFVVWLVTVPLRGRSVTGLIASVVITGPLAVLGGIGWALLPGPDAVAGPEQALLLAAVAVLVAAVESGLGAARAYRRFARSRGALLTTLDQIVDGEVPHSVGPPLLSELESVRVLLSDAARALAAGRARDHALDESRRQLIAWVSHDLHAPLTVLQAMSETLDRTDPVVREEVERLVAVVDDLFDLATATTDQAGRSLVLSRREPAVLADVLGEAVATLEPLARLRGVGIHVRGLTRLQVSLVDPDGADLGRALLTLMVDAIRHSPAGTEVQIEVSPDDSTPGHVRLRLTPGALTQPSRDVVPIVAGGAFRQRFDVRLPVCVPAGTPVAV